MAAGGIDDERVDLDPCVEAGAFHGVNQLETSTLPVNEWRAETLAAFVESLPTKRVTKDGKDGPYHLVSKVIFETELSAEELLVSGPKLLLERCEKVTRGRSLSRLKVACPAVVRTLEAEARRDAERQTLGHECGNALNFWERLKREGNEEEQAMVQAMEGSLTGYRLQSCLGELVPREAIRFCRLDVGPGQSSVTCVEDRVSCLSEDQQELFKVVSVCEAGVVTRNFIFSRDESEDNATGVSGEWLPLVSVDFATHGTALPGHWHINSTPSGEPMPHWGPNGTGKGLSVFHGDHRSCPLWWQIIPQGCTYQECPDRKFIKKCRTTITEGNSTTKKQMGKGSNTTSKANRR